MSKKMPAKYPIKSLVRAFRVLDAIGGFESGINITGLSQNVKMGKSTIHRLLATLREHDMVWLDPSTSRYSLGPHIVRWNDMLLGQNFLVRCGLPILQELVKACGETANLAVLDGTDIVFVAQYETKERLRMTKMVGARVAAHSTSLGKALLATMSDEELDDLYQGDVKLEGTAQWTTAKTITSMEQLKEHLHQVRQDGIAYDFEENAVGVFCMGTVVRNSLGQPAAAISISMPVHRLRGDSLIALRQHLLGAEKRLSTELGYDPKRESSGALRGKLPVAELL